MAYKKKPHRNTHQLKSRLNDNAYADLEAEAIEREMQPGALVRELTLAALRFKEHHGYFPLLDGQELADRTLDDYPMLREKARELKISPRELADRLIRLALALKLEQAQMAAPSKNKRSA
ncbi:MAG: hypothetical protein JWP42_3998 [Pseudomonas sp.]|nr:hypothetical protein [Pseudomonas sp.]